MLDRLKLGADHESDIAPKRRSAAAPPPPAEKKPRQSKLAKENNISTTTETEIREAFQLFTTSDDPSTIPTSSFRRALTALGISPSSNAEHRELLDTVDPSTSGVVEFEHFVAIAALKLQNRSDEDINEEVEAAFRLFVGGGRGAGGGDEKITIGTLRRVAKELKMEGEVGEGVLRDMILEANGGAGVGAGVGREDFEGVMRRAGVFK